jgi:hypothetical protein
MRMHVCIYLSIHGRAWSVVTLVEADESIGITLG